MVSFDNSERSIRTVSFRLFSPIVLLSIGLALAVPNVSGQTADGLLRGSVKDERGAVMSDVRITAWNATFPDGRLTVTDAAGHYQLSLPPGAYTVAADGIGQFCCDRVVIGAGKTTEYDMVIDMSELRDLLDDAYGAEAGFGAWQALALVSLAIPALVLCHAIVALIIAGLEYRRTRVKGPLVLGLTSLAVAVVLPVLAFTLALDFGVVYATPVVLLTLGSASRWFLTRTFFPSGVMTAVGILMFVVVNLLLFSLYRRPPH